MNLTNFTNPPGLMRQTLSAQAAGTKLRGKYMTSATKSLDLLRLNIQNTINKEIDAILNKYLVKFFNPAMENIRKNLGENSITEDTMRTVCRQILEDAKIQYCRTMPSQECSPHNVPETGSMGENKLELVVPQSPVRVLNKRKESDSDFEANQSIGKLRKKVIKSGSNINPNVQGPLKLIKFENIKREGPKWDPNRVVKSTLFIMGARANKVLGFGQTRGRLYTKHPELLKYSGDAEDKEWLTRHNLIPPTGGIAYLLILDDVKELAESDEYRHNPNVLLGDLKGFQAPDFMLNKIRAFMKQTRSKDKDHVNFTYSDDLSNRVDTQFNYNAGWDFLALTSPSTVSESTPVMRSELRKLANCSKNFLVPATLRDVASSRANGLLYDSVIFTDASKPN